MRKEKSCTRRPVDAEASGCSTQPTAVCLMERKGQRGRGASSQKGTGSEVLQLLDFRIRMSSLTFCVRLAISVEVGEEGRGKQTLDELEEGEWNSACLVASLSLCAGEWTGYFRSAFDIRPLSLFPALDRVGTVQYST